MFRKNAIILLVLKFCLATAQSGSAGSATAIPNQIPPTPETFKFTKYGEIPVNEASGNATLDIPLFVFKAGRVALPMSISHTGGAVRVDEATTWTGINWQLNVGGLVSRTVNDLPDENTNSTSRLLYSSGELHSFIPGQSNELVALASNNTDSEVDIFNYNFDGYSGSFYLDKGLIPRLIKYDKELKIELSENPVIGGILQTNLRTITITTPEGTKYYFGGISASESTRVKSGVGAFTVYGQTGFYLFKIQNFFGDILTFNYSKGGPSSEIIGYSQTLTKDYSMDPSADCAPHLGIHTSSPKVAYLESSGKLKLNTILSNRDNSKIVFNSSYQSDASLNRFVLNNIMVYDDKNTIHKKIAFDYLLPNNGTFEKRFFLEKISVFEGANTTSDNIHFFEYNTPEQLPDRFSYSQDYAGYYNGKSNITYIPKVSDPFFSGMGSVILADRSVVFNKAVCGSLKKVIYPTKGYTEFEYETGLKPPTEYESANRYLNVYHNDPSRGGSSLYISSADSYAIVNYDEIINILNPSVPINVTINATVNGSLTQHHFLKFTLDDLDSTNDIVNLIPLVNSQNTEKTYSKNYQFSNLNPLGRYKFYLEYYRTSATAYPIFLNANAQVAFGTNIALPNYKPGIRIKKTKSYASSASQPIITRYYYNKAANKLNEADTEYGAIEPHFTSESIVIGSCDGSTTGGLDCSPYTIFSRNINSDTQNNLYASGSRVFENVTISYGGDNFENGGKESSFFVNPDVPLNSLSFNDSYVSIRKVSNGSLKNGTLLRETYFSSDATFNTTLGQISSGKVKEVINSYISIPEKNNKITSCFVSQIHKIPECIVIPNSLMYVSNNYYGHYDTFSWWHTLEKTETNEYFGNGIINNQIEYFYDSRLAGLPSRIINKTNTGETLETINLYPPDLLTEPYMPSLKSQFRIGQPVNVKKYKNSILQSTQNIIYQFDDSISGLVLPLANQFAKGDKSLENQVVYHQYDIKGNPIEISLESGIHIVYIWGYNKTQPIAKIENATYDQVVLQVASLQSLSDADNDNCLTATCKEQLLRIQLNNLRNSLPNAFVTTYTYNPLVGITSVTDPKGVSSYYEYDSFNRLKFIKDQNLNILQRYCYNYKGELQADCSDLSSTTVITYTSIIKSGTYTKNSCAIGGVGSSVTYTVAAGAYTSTISQADADAKAQTDVTTNGQTYANTNGTCTFTSVAKSESFTRNNCAVEGTGSTVTYTVAVGAYSSTLSQADADAKAQTDVTTNGQNYANINGTCAFIFYNIEKSAWFTKNDCLSGTFGTSVLYVVPAGSYSSLISQEDADYNAQFKFNVKGQNYANSVGKCTTTEQ
jgi:hypothetical protein